MFTLRNRFKGLPPFVDFILPIIGGISLTFSFAPFELSILAWFSFIPLFYSLENGRFPFFKSFIMGLAFFSTLLYWVPLAEVEGAVLPQVILGFFLLMIYLSSFFGFSGILYNKLERLGFVCLFPFVFTGLEFLRSLSSVWGFPWGSVGFSQTNLIHLNQFASIGGLPLVTLWVLFLNVLVYLFLKSLGKKNKKKMVYVYFFVALLVLPLMYSEIVLHRDISKIERKSVGVIQPNVLPEDKRKKSFKRLSKIKELFKKCSSADLYVLPETASPFPLSHNRNARKFFRGLAKEKRVPIITGMHDYERKEGQVVHYNAAAVVDSTGIKGVYRKIFLLPFVERLPFDDVIPELKKVDLGQGHLTPGSNYPVFAIGSLKFSVFICYEAVFPQLVRNFANKGANLLVNITEDGWFGSTTGPYQHAQMAVFQSILFRKALVRSANTGVSVITTPYGQIKKRTEIYREGCIVDEVSLLEGKTIYAKIGNVFGWVFLFLVFFLLFYREEVNR